jgi:hypothetical protein
VYRRLLKYPVNKMSEIYIGTVIDNSDISDTRNEHALGRVLVMIRGKSDIASSESFKNPKGKNLNRSMSDETQTRVRDTEVWAFVLQPNTGGAAGSYNAGSDITKPSSDSNNPTSIYTKAPAAAYSGNAAAGNAGTDPGSSATNTTDANFTPDNRDGAVKGIYTIPPVGATVAISFIHGKRGLPIVIGTLVSGEAINSIHSTDSGAQPSYPITTKH